MYGLVLLIPDKGQVSNSMREGISNLFSGDFLGDPNGKSGIYRAEDLEVGAVFQVSISNNTWSESKKLCSYCETTYSSGFIEGNELMYNYGGVSVKVGVISGNAVIMNYSGTQITLEMDGSVN